MEITAISQNLSHFGTDLEKFGKTCKVLEKFGNHLDVIANIWYYRVANSGKSLEPRDSFGSIAIVFTKPKSWQVFQIFGNNWNSVETFEHLWKHLDVAANIWYHRVANTGKKSELMGQFW